MKENETTRFDRRRKKEGKKEGEGMKRKKRR